MLRILSALFVLVGCFQGLPPAAASPPGGQIHRVGNRALQLGIDARDGACRELVDPGTGFNHLSVQEKPLALWTITARDGDAVTTFAADESGPPRVDSVPGGLRLVWDHAGPASMKPLRVEATVRLDGEDTSLSRWEISVAKPPRVLLESIRFPRLTALAPREHEYVAVPQAIGMLAANPRKLAGGPDGRGGRLEWLYPGLSLQCLAYYADAGPGFYAACDDPLAHVKRFALWGDAQGRMHFEMVHLPEQGAADREHYPLPYAVVLGAFRGDWTTAAELYRASAAARAFAEQGRLHRGLVPPWVRETGLWVWNRGRSPGVLPPARRLQEHVATPVSVLWHWWHHCAYDEGFPEYFPPREGTAAFEAALEAAHRDGVHAILYMNQRLWGTTTASWTAEGAAAFAVKKPDGTIPAEVYNTFTKAPCAPMCIGTEFWRDKYAGMAERAIRDLAADGVYMDQAGTSLPCHDVRHGHPCGWGRYWTEGFGRLADEIRRRGPEGRPAVLAGEFCGEAWLSSLDLMLALEVSRERYLSPGGWEVIPFFQAVYHGDAVTFGNYSSLIRPPYEELWPREHAPAEQLTPLDRRFARQFYLEQARTFVWGQQPMLANFLPEQLDQRPEEIDYVTRLVRTRKRALKYLFDGKWLRPPAVQTPRRDVEFARVSIYAPLASTTKSHPSVLASAWRAPDGDVAVALASIADEPIGLDVPVDFNGYGVRQRPCVWRIDETGRRRHGTLDLANPTLRIELPPRALCLLEFCRE